MKKHTYREDSGMVAIVVTVIIMIILTLIVITFAKISGRNQRQSLDQQLHTQALYAAESGINDAIDYLKIDKAYVKDGCTTALPGPGRNKNLDGGATSYSCLLIDPTPTNLEFGNIGKGESRVVPIERESGSIVNELTIHWQDPDENENLSGCPVTITELPSSWPQDTCGPGMLRIDLVNLPSAPPIFSRDYLLNNTHTAFFVPPQNGGTLASTPQYPFNSAIGFGGQGEIKPARCRVPNTVIKPKHCSVQITGMTGMNGKKYYIRITALYKAATVTMCTETCGGNSSTTHPFAKGAQAKVDSTGKVSDILRRIQVHVSTSDLDGPFPSYAIESSFSICKRFSTIPPSTVNFDPGSECGIL